MSNYFGLIQLGLLASLGFAALVALVSIAAYPLLRPVLTSLTPARRSNILLAWLLSPACIGLLFTLLSFTPSLLSMFGISPDHCSMHDGHLHLCLIHPPLPAGGMLWSILIIFLGAVALFFAGVYSLSLVRVHRLHRTLMIASRQCDERDIRIVEWGGPLAISAGIYHMRVFISEHLMRALTPQQLDVVLAHERMHVQRKDGLRHLLGHAFSFVHIPWLRRRLLADMDLACEQACDEAAAIKTGDRLHVAATIVSIERMLIQKQPAFMALSISGSCITQRVESLLHSPAIDSPSWRGYLRLTGTVLLIATFASAEVLHHQTESILGFLTRYEL